MSPSFLAGSLICSVGFAVLFAVLARAGALAKSKQLGALARILRGEAGPRERAALLCALVLCLAGACLLFTAVAEQDAIMRDACADACRERGLAGGHIAHSTRADLRACFCGEGEGAEQLYDIGPNGRPARPDTPPR